MLKFPEMEIKPIKFAGGNQTIRHVKKSEI